MACYALSQSAALAGARVGTAAAPTASSSPHARFRLPALLTARSLTTRCARGRRDNNTAPPPRASSSSWTLPPHEAEAAAALAGAVADAFRPLLDNLNHLRSMRTVLDVEDYHIGMPIGALLACVGLYQVCKVDPSTCLDVALAYAFYKLSVLAADVRGRGFSNHLITRIQLAISVTMAFKGVQTNIVLLDYIRFPIFIIYTVSVLWDLAGLKNYANSFFRDAFELLKTKDGRRRLLRLLLLHGDDNELMMKIIMQLAASPQGP